MGAAYLKRERKRAGGDGAHPGGYHCPALLVPKPRGDHPSHVQGPSFLTPGSVASQSQIPLESRKQGSWVGVSPRSSQTHSSRVPTPTPKPSPCLRGLTKERGAWPDSKEAHLGGTRAAGVSGAGGQASHPLTASQTWTS